MMHRFCLAILFFAAVGVMPAAFAQSAAQPPLISVVKKGADKNTVSLSGLQASGPYGQLFVKTLTRDLELSGWFKVARRAR